MFCFVWGGIKVLSTNVLHNLYQKNYTKKKKRKVKRGGLVLAALASVCFLKTKQTNKKINKKRKKKKKLLNWKDPDNGFASVLCTRL